MLWMTWRQHRVAVLSFTVLFAVLIALYLANWDALRACFTGQDCSSSRTKMLGFLSGTPTLVPYTAVFVCAFLGAPLVAGEFEQRSYRFAWSQGVSRQRWLWSKVTLLGSAVLVLSTSFAVVYRLWFDPLAAVTGWLEPRYGFSLGLVTFPAYCLFGFALGVAVGAVLRRVGPAMAVALVVFLEAWGAIGNWLRPHYLPPLEVLGYSPEQVNVRSDSPAWSLGIDHVDRDGRAIGWEEGYRIAGVDPVSTDSAQRQALLERAGVRVRRSYQPDDRFWTFQLIETGLLLLLVAGCLAFAFWWLRRRPA